MRGVKNNFEFNHILKHAFVLSLCMGLFGVLPVGVCLAADTAEWTEEERVLVDLEDLVSMQVTSVSKRAQNLSESAAAIFVITQEDIRRIGAVSIPEALRIVPGLEVAHATQNNYAISSRGLNNLFADKLLVLIDGRSVYTPIFGGVFWDVQDTMLEDIDRIEVIRGPGATLWGANAVNGVINIITKRAKDTQGRLVVAGGGTQERAFASARYGGSAQLQGGDVHYRVFGKFNNRAPMELADRSNGPDDSQTERGGFRMDWDATDRDSVTVQGDFYNGKIGLGFDGLEEMDKPPVSWEDDWDVRGGNILGRWTRDYSDTNSFSLQAYYDRADRDSVALGIERDTVDFDFQHRIQWLAHNDLTWGLGYRRTSTNIDNSISFSFDPDDRSDNLYTGFVQNETRLMNDRLRLTVGSKVEHNDYTGWELQPSARALYMLGESQSVWASASRALQTGSRLEDITVTRFQMAADDPNNPYGLQINGQVSDRGRHAQRVYAFEAGYRVMPTERVSVDLAVFHNEYRWLISMEGPDGTVDFWPDPPSLPTALLVQAPFDDRIQGHSRGAELSAIWQVLHTWRLGAGYTYLKFVMDDSRTTGSVDEEEGNYPPHQYNLRSYVDLPAHLQWDTMLYYVGKVKARDISSYYRLDVRLGWKASENLEFSLVGQNLTKHRHAEWSGDFGFVTTEVPRSGYAKVTWKF